LIALVAQRWSPGGDPIEPRIERGTLFASGLVAGDALLGLVVTIFVLIKKSGENPPFALRNPGGDWWEMLIAVVPFAILVAGLCWSLFARKNREVRT